jgi:hypothetical protein
MSELVFFQISEERLKARFGAEEFELPLQRDSAGQFTSSCRAELIASIGSALTKHQIRPGTRALCAIDGRGVSLRRISMPAAPREEFQRLLMLQLEREFPLPPEQLAWGSSVVGRKDGRQDLLVAAVRKETLQPFTDVFAACGLKVDFTVAALAHAAQFQPPEGSCAALHLGRRQSDLLLYKDGFPEALRVLNWGIDNVPDAPIPGIVFPKIYLANAESVALPHFIGGVPCARLQPAASPEPTPLVLRSSVPQGRVTLSDVKSRKPLVLAAALLCAVALFPLIQALVMKPFLAHRISTLNAGKDRLGAIDREFTFLQNLKASQPPYLETLYLMSKSAPPGTSFDSVSMGRRGEISMRGKLANAQQVTDFRSKLIAAGWFSSVIVEEQTPTPDRRVTVRMTAQLKDAASRKPLPEEKPHKTP